MMWLRLTIIGMRLSTRGRSWAWVVLHSLLCWVVLVWLRLALIQRLVVSLIGIRVIFKLALLVGVSRLLMRGRRGRRVIRLSFRTCRLSSVRRFLSSGFSGLSVAK